MQQLSCGAKILEIKNENEKTILILDQTVFYPQGGGQPFDNGVILSGENTFQVDEVRFLEGQVFHIGNYSKGK